MKEIGKPYEAGRIDLGGVITRQPASDLNPKGKAPTFVHDYAAGEAVIGRSWPGRTDARAGADSLGFAGTAAKANG